MLRNLAAGGRRAGVLRCLTTISELDAGGVSSLACQQKLIPGQPASHSVPLAHTFQQHSRGFSVDFPATLGIDPDKVDDGEPQEIDTDHFHRVADLTMGELLQKVDSFLKQQGRRSDDSMRVDLTQGKLQIQLGEGRALLVAKDPEARQLHTSGLGGDVSYALSEESSGVLQTSGTEGPRWTSLDGDADLHEVVEDELKAATGQRIDLEPEPRSGYGPDPT